MGAESFLTLQIADFAEGVDDRVAALLQAGTGITLTYNDGANTLTIANTGLGGSTGSTDNRVLRADGTGGATVQNSAVTIDDSGNISGLGSITCTGTIQGTGLATLTLRSQGIRSSRGFEAESNDLFYWTNRSVIASPSDGVIQLRDFAGTTFNRIQFGGSTSSFPALKRSGSTLQVRLADDSAAGALDCGAITASGNILPEADETRSIGSASLRYLAGHFRQLVVTSSSVNPQIQFGASGEGYIERASSALQIGYGFSSNLSIGSTFINAGVPFRFPPYTVATLPNVATHTGRTVRVTDSSVTTFHSIVAGGGSDMVLVLSDGTNWRVR